jgi:pyruvate/2-oxoglutarate dehydrogenase complex dihydrolipoamide dehydrogenase (E3) component
VKNDGEGDDGKDNSILGKKHILIATGSKPANSNFRGIENAITSDQFLEFESDHLPEKIVFVGGGYISFEFAHLLFALVARTSQFCIGANNLWSTLIQIL